MLDLDIHHRQGSFELRVTAKIGPGLTAVNGASGSGKTTLLKIVAGLIRPEIGRVAFDNIFFTDSARGIWLPPHKRRCGVVFQEARLFPHLTVKQNLLYGQWFNRRPGRRETRQDIIALLGIEALLGRAPATLSGGEAQRVALGRALFANPRLLLMDEPLSALDSARKEEILPYLEWVRDCARIPILYVSHTQSEIKRLANRVITLEAGQILPSASPPLEGSPPDIE